MTALRVSYWKTVGAALLVGCVAVGALAGLTRVAWLVRGSWSLVGWLLLVGLTLVVSIVVAWAALVAVGGLLSLHRDALETRGVPYGRREPREWVAGPAVRAIRSALRRLRGVVRPSAGHLALRPGELVEIRSLDEILSTLDERGTLGGLPFMPEMAKLCGKRFSVLRRVDKIYDWVLHTGLRRLHDTVLLEELRCSGECHGGCQAGCHLLWKEAWLRRATAATAGNIPVVPPVRQRASAADLQHLTQRMDEAGAARYVCQMTQLVGATTPIAWADPRHFLRDLVHGNVRLRPFLAGVGIAMFNWVQRKRGGVGFPYRAPGSPNSGPPAIIDLQPGEVVRVKRKSEIEQTLDHNSRNRGLWFDGDMHRFSGGEYRVATRVEQLIDEKSGKMVHLRNPCIVLESVSATGEYLAFCPQNERIFWREAWLERVEAEKLDASL